MSEPSNILESANSEMQQRMRQVLNSDRAALSPAELRELQQRIALALDDLMILDEEGIEFQIKRSQGKRILELRLPVLQFVRDNVEEKSK